MSFRKYKPDDMAQCLEIYSLNEPGRFPKLDPSYETTLKQGTAYTLVAEKEGRIAACGRLAYFSPPGFFRRNWAVLSFGLVHPEHQGEGLGTALVLARFALLKTSDSYYRVVIGAVAKSIGFYQRFGFATIQPWKDKQGNEHPTAMLEISRREILKCRELLGAHEIHVPADQELVPTMEIPVGDRAVEVGA